VGQTRGRKFTLAPAPIGSKTRTRIAIPREREEEGMWGAVGDRGPAWGERKRAGPKKNSDLFLFIQKFKKDVK
jgi:hypothetical protein